MEKRTLVWAFAFTDGWMPFYDLLFVTVVLVVNVVVVVNVGVCEAQHNKPIRKWGTKKMFGHPSLEKAEKGENQTLNRCVNGLSPRLA